MIPTGTTIGGFELAVHDLERAVEFYSTALGMKVRAREDHGDFQEAQIIGEGDTAAVLLVSPRPGVTPEAPSTSAKLALITDDVRAVYARAVEAGAEEAQAPTYHEPMDVWYAHLRDLDGHTVQLIQRRK